MTLLLWDIFERIRQKQTRFAGKGSESRDRVDVEDAAELLVKASDCANANYPISNAVSGGSASVKEGLIRVGQDIYAGRASVFLGEQRLVDLTKQLAENFLLQSWVLRPKVHWADGVAQYVKWCRAGEF